jgi:SpoVK/Ycf46/Vps4 family AAA+-type ATPase
LLVSHQHGHDFDTLKLLTPLQILDADMKESIRSDVDRFFSSRETYQNLKVPWKRGIIYYGPPGNGKTISIKATMHTLYERKDPIPTLYVRSLSSFAGPEYSINEIFSLARRTAPCYLVFEDLDTIVSDNVRSYFLNEVDGIKRNDGILMLGSTNHLDRLDPGISKRPSRFDRKYLFPNPDEPQRVQYAHYWQKKLESNEEIEFPDVLCEGIASITGGFSFAYIQEAMVASLLAIAAGGEKGKAEQLVGDVGKLSLENGGDKDLEKLVLWREIKKQVKILRDEMGEEDGEAAMRPAMSSENKAALKEMEVAVQDIKGQLKTLTQDLHIVREHSLRFERNGWTQKQKLRAVGNIENGITKSKNFVHNLEETVGLITEDGELRMREENQDSIRIVNDGVKRLTDELCALQQEVALCNTCG